MVSIPITEEELHALIQAGAIAMNQIQTFIDEERDLEEKVSLVRERNELSAVMSSLAQRCTCDKVEGT
jgi:ATP-dependent helicase YprA (DUF1998 family)